MNESLLTPYGSQRVTIHIVLVGNNSSQFQLCQTRPSVQPLTTPLTMFDYVPLQPVTTQHTMQFKNGKSNLYTSTKKKNNFKAIQNTVK